MLIDGIHALATGSYIAPAGGEYSGQLGPWAWVLGLMQIDPLGMPAKLAFVLLGLIWLVHVRNIVVNKVILPAAVRAVRPHAVVSPVRHDHRRHRTGRAARAGLHRQEGCVGNAPMNGNRAILVTGASTGIGHATALRLAEAGFTVFAGVRKESDARDKDRFTPTFGPCCST